MEREGWHYPASLGWEVVSRADRCLVCYWLNRDHYFCQKGKERASECSEFKLSDYQGRLKLEGGC